MKNTFTTTLLSLCFVVNLASANNAELVNFVVNLATTDVGCHNGSDGSVTFDLQGGVEPYSILEAGLQIQINGSSYEIDNLAAGTYVATFSDNSGCLVTRSWTINDGEEIQLNINCGQDENNILVTVMGGEAPYAFTWSNGFTGASIIGEEGTNYTLTVTDSFGCTAVDSYYFTASDSFDCVDGLTIGVLGDDPITSPIISVTPDMLLDGLYSTCNRSFEFNITDDQGVELLPYSDVHWEFCDYIGEVQYNLRDNISGLECSGTLFLEDVGLPLPFCVNNNTVILDENQEATIYAIDFGSNSFDFCDGTDLRFTFSNVAPELDPNYDSSLKSSSMMLSCLELYSVNSISVYIWDNSGNSDYCQVSLNIEDPQGGCQPEGNHLEVVDGICNIGLVDRYNILLNGNDLDNLGCYYSLEDDYIIAGENIISITNTDETTSLNGISTLDLVLLMRGFLDGFENPMDAVLGDFDGDLAISTQDLIKMRLLIIGVLNELNIPDYKIFPANYSFPADFNPFNQPEDFLTYRFDESELTGAHLVNILKSGDLNNSALFAPENLSSTRESAILSFDNQSMKAGELYTIDFELSANSDFYAATFELLSDHINVIATDFYDFDVLENVSEGNITISYQEFDAKNKINFTLEIEALQDMDLSDVFTLNDDFYKEIVYQDLGESSISLSANEVTADKEIETTELSIYPNPAEDFIVFDFGEESAGKEKEIFIHSLDGRLLHSYRFQESSVTINTNLFSNSGLHFARIKVGEIEKSRKFFIK